MQEGTLLFVLARPHTLKAGAMLCTEVPQAQQTLVALEDAVLAWGTSEVAIRRRSLSSSKVSLCGHAAATIKQQY